MIKDSEIFKVGEPIETVWLHMEFDFEDTQKYIGGVAIKTEVEAKRLIEKYLTPSSNYK